MLQSQRHVSEEGGGGGGAWTAFQTPVLIFLVDLEQDLGEPCASDNKEVKTKVLYFGCFRAAHYAYFP